MSSARNPQPRTDERGIALVAAVLVVLLSTLLVATFMATTTGERAMSSNVQTAKISLYAADAGIRTQQQQLANLAQAKIDSCVTAWNNAGGTGMVITKPDSLFPNGTFTTNSAAPNFSASGTIKYFSPDTTITPNYQSYTYRFTIQSTGTVGTAGTRRVQAQGNLLLSATRGTFADYLIFLNQQTSSSGSQIWFTSSVTMDGRVHSNGIMNFAYKPTFTDAVTSSNSKANYYNAGSPLALNANNNGTVDVPNFLNGFQRSQPNVPLPTNAYNQQYMSLNWTSTTPPTNTDINNKLGTGAGSGTPPNGIYFVNDGISVGGGVSGTMKGGLYIQGDLTQAKMWADTTANKQWYQLTQGSTVKTICVDPSLGQTWIWNSSSSSGSPAVKLAGAPNGLLYCNGAINDLRGPDRSGATVLPAVAEGTKLLITAQNDIVIQRDITCDSYNNNNNVLGIFTPGGSIRIGSGAPQDMNLDAFVMATSSTNGQFAVDNYNSGSPRGTFHLRGGIVENFYGAFFTFNTAGVLQTGYARDFHYDRRGLTPPFYPSTIKFNSNEPSAHTLAWKEI